MGRRAPALGQHQRQRLGSVQRGAATHEPQFLYFVVKVRSICVKLGQLLPDCRPSQ
jgi:hypothetical protein